jgi:hypothetical protein
MTIRSVINNKKRRIFLGTCLGGGIFFVGILLSMLNQNLLIVTLVGLVVACVALFYGIYRITCPRCNGSWGYIALYSGGPFSISKKIKFCPFCGADVDSALEQKPIE